MFESMPYLNNTMQRNPFILHILAYNLVTSKVPKERGKKVCTAKSLRIKIGLFHLVEPILRIAGKGLQ